jgi:hypothetical protein
VRPVLIYTTPKPKEGYIMSILDHLRLRKPQPDAPDDKAVFLAAIPCPEARDRLIVGMGFGELRASFYLEAFSHKPIMWLVPPHSYLPGRFTPEEWEAFYRALVSAGIAEARTTMAWLLVWERGHHGH